MRIHSLHIDGFGRFADRSFGPLEHPVTVFYGPNEAGKSTLLEFIRRILFGFPARRGRINEYPPLAGGRHGGRITICADDGRRVTVQRVSGRGSGTVALSSVSGEAMPTDELTGLLGNHSRSVFESIFGFTLDELHDESLLSDDSVNRQIYSAGIGAMRLPTALDTLETQKQEIFLPRGSNQIVPKVMAQIQETETALRSVAEHGMEYRRQSERLAEIDRDLKDVSEHRLQLMSEKERHENLVRAWDPWNDFISAEQQLAELPAVEAFPENGTVLLESLETRTEAALQELSSADERVKRIKASVDEEIEHLVILENSNEVSELERRRSAFDQSVKDLPERRAELSSKRSELDTSLANLGPDWDAERLNSFDLSLVVREEVANYGERLQNARAAIGRSQTALAQEETALADAQEDAERAQVDRDNAASPDLDENNIRERRRRIRQSKNTLAELDRVEGRSKDLREQVGDDPEPAEGAANGGRNRLLAGLLGVLGVALLVAGILLALTASPGGGSALAVIGAVLFTAAAFLFIRGRSPIGATASPVAARIRRQIHEADEQLGGIRSRLQEEAAALGLEALDADSLVEAEEGLDTSEVRLREWQQLETRLAQATERAERQTLRRDEAQQAAQSAQAALEAEEQSWQTWLQQRGLLSTFSPDSIHELRTLVDLARTHHRDVVEMQNRIAAIQTDIEEFIDIARPLAEAHGFEAEWSDYPRVAGVADDIIDLHREVSESARTRAVDEKELEEAQQDLAARRKNNQEVADEIGALLKSGEADDAEDFRRRDRVYQERAVLNATISNSLEQMQRISGPGEALEALRIALAQTDLQTIRDSVRQCDAQLEEIDAQRSELDTERGSIRTTLEGLAGEEDSSRLRLERHRLAEELQGHARDWAVRTIAESLIRQARGKFEKERQPDVIRHAERFFLDVTDGAYQAVYSPLGSSEINVRDAAGNIRIPQLLSRGTREQLFLALRFGLILELGQRAERLPVIVDEALVNFDPIRGTRAAGSFIDLSETNQVLVFTCHPQIVDWFVNAAAQRGAAEPEVVGI
jgi:uncharacterized protein YhaN